MQSLDKKLCLLEWSAVSGEDFNLEMLSPPVSDMLIYAPCITAMRRFARSVR